MASCKKKGQLYVGAAIFVVILFVFAVVAIGGNYVMKQINDGLQADDTVPEVSKNISAQNTSAYSDIMTGGYLFIFILFWIFLLIGAYFVESHPVMFIIALILVVLLLVVTMYLGNTFDEIAEDDELSTSADDMPIIVFINSNILLVVLAMIITSLIVMFARDR